LVVDEEVPTPPTEAEIERDAIRKNITLGKPVSEAFNTRPGFAEGSGQGLA